MGILVDGNIQLGPATANGFDLTGVTAGNPCDLRARGTDTDIGVGVITKNNGGFSMSSADNSGTPGNTTINRPLGRCAIAAGSNNVVVTNSTCVAGSQIFVTLLTVDATLTQILNVAQAVGSFTITGNANATGNPKVCFHVIQPR